jgi:putative hydrolase of the HAD superfamily
VSFDTIAVDLGGVAATFQPATRSAVIGAATGLTVDDVESRLFASGLDARLERGEFTTTDEAMTLLLDALDRRLSLDALVAAWSRAFVPNGDVLGLLARRSERIILFTNNGPIVQTCLAGPLGAIGEVCAQIVCSWQLRATKPVALAFERFAVETGSTAQQLILVDDSPANVEAARQAGWAAELVTSATDLQLALSREEYG